MTRSRSIAARPGVRALLLTERVGRPFANLIAVDFSDRGEVIPFVAALNGVDTS
jgi:hypothetical protein